MLSIKKKKKKASDIKFVYLYSTIKFCPFSLSQTETPPHKGIETTHFYTRSVLVIPVSKWNHELGTVLYG
jgi:hypothetical protein